MKRWIVVVAGLLGAVGVAIGAYAAHGLEASLLEQGLEEAAIAKRLSQCDVAVRYHMMHTLALFALGLAGIRSNRRLANAVAVAFLVGIFLFSGGLYSMVFAGVMGHWAIVPAGGLCFILGWLLVGLLGLLGSASQVDTSEIGN